MCQHTKFYVNTFVEIVFETLMIIISSFQTSAVDNIVSLGGCVEKMMLGMAMFGKNLHFSES